MSIDPPQKYSSKNVWLLLAGFVALKLLIHLSTNFLGGYGYFRDELYYIACSEHLDIGYVDQPPLSIFILAASRAIIGDSIFALRLLPAMAGAATVLLTGLIAREFGGQKKAVLFACGASIVSLANIALDAIYSMNAFDYLFWALAIYVTVRLINTQSVKYWLMFGVVIGLGAFNKIDVIWLGGGLTIGLLISEHRVWYKTRWPWIAGAIAVVLFAPFVIWNFFHDMAHLEFIRNATSGKYAGLSPATFMIGQIKEQNPSTFPLWFTGLCVLLFVPGWKRYRPLGVAYIVVFLLLIVNEHSKSEYLSPVYGVMFAAGGVAFEHRFSVPRFVWATYAYAILMVVSLIFAPAVLPILPAETYIKYADALGIKPSTAESKELGKLPQFYADMFGWEEKVAAVAKVYHSLTPEEQSKCAIFADNYGRCAAIDFWRAKYFLPASIGKHNNYWIWGPRGYTGDVVIILGGDLEGKTKVFQSVEIAGTVAHNEYCMPYENDLKIYICRHIKVPFNDLWQKLKLFS